MRRRLWLFITATLLTGAAMIATLISWTPQQASAHQTKEVGGGRYRVIVGMVREPSFTNERNGLDLIVRTADNQPGEGLERSVNAEIIAPDGATRRRFQIRPQRGRPGYYTDDVLLARPGVYRIPVWGNIGDVSFDETFETHEVRPLSTLRFP